jgi:hypothetical protein
VLCAVSVAMGLCLPLATSGAEARELRPRIRRGPAAKVAADFSPDRLGGSSTIKIGMEIKPSPSEPATPVSKIVLRFPQSLGFATSGLGLASCVPSVLLKLGPEACPANSKMGSGKATVVVPFGPALVREKVTLQLYAAPSSDGYVHLVVYAHGKEPVIAAIVLSGVLLPGRIEIRVPAIVSIPGAPNVSLVSLQASIGGALTYFERVHGKTHSYHPRGIGLPDVCPSGGWKLGASFAFTDGRRSSAKTVVPCPGER